MSATHEAAETEGTVPQTSTNVPQAEAPTTDTHAAAAPGAAATGNDAHVEADRDALAPPAAAETSNPLSPSASASATADGTDASLAASETKRMSALTSLLRVLDSDDNDADTAAAAPSLRALQKMCMRLPQLSDALSRPQRYQLYTRLLLDDIAEAAVPPSWTAYADKALETHINVAQQAAALFPESLQVTVEELSGLFYHLGAETAFYFNPEMTDVILCMTYVVAGSRSTDKASLLSALYQLLCVLQKDFLVSTASRLYEPATTALLRLMLQFYDPALATHMDQQQVNIGTYVLEWTRRLLVLQSDMDTALKVLDWVFVLGDPVMIPYVALAYLVTHRQHLLTLQNKQSLTACLAEMRFVLPSSKAEAVDPQLADGRATALMPVWSGKSLLQNADLLYRVTPLSTQRMLDFCLYPDVGTLNKTPEDLQQYYANTPCLPLERSDLASAFAKRNDGDALPTREYIVVDCRSQASFDYVRLPTAVLVGDVLSYQQAELAEAMHRLESCRGHALALFGTGRAIVEEVNLLKVLALFLINKKAFPFVSIVPGGFKTTIPLLRNHVIEAIMSPAAAASLDATAKTAGTDWDQQASATAHNIGAKLSEISSLLPHVEVAEVRQKAEEFSSKAKESVSAAGTWGWGMMQRLKEGLSGTREQASTAFVSVATKLNEATATAAAPDAVPTAPAAPSTVSAAQPTAAAPVAQPGAARTNSITTAVKAAAVAQPQQIFSLGDDGEEEDLDLITSIPTRPMRGTVVDVANVQQAEVPHAQATPSPTAAEAAAPVSATPAEAPQPPQRQQQQEEQPPAAAATMATRVQEVSPTPERRPAPPTESIGASPVPVPPPQPAKPAVVSSPNTAAVATSGKGAVPPRGASASASQIAANIDAEFDELFGELNTSPSPTTHAAAKPSAAITEDDLFGE